VLLVSKGSRVNKDLWDLLVLTDSVEPRVNEEKEARQAHQDGMHLLDLLEKPVRLDHREAEDSLEYREKLANGDRKENWDVKEPEVLRVNEASLVQLVLLDPWDPLDEQGNVENEVQEEFQENKAP